MLINARKKRRNRTPRAVLEQRRMRQTLEAAIEQAIAALDEFDGDADLEPVNGSTLSFDQRLWSAGGDQDEREWVTEDEGSVDEREPDVDAESEVWPTFGAQCEPVDLRA